MISILGSLEGVARSAAEGGGDGIQVVVGAIDKDLGGTGGGMIVPGYVSLTGTGWGFLLIGDCACVLTVLAISATVCSKPLSSAVILRTNKLHCYKRRAS